MGRLLTIWEKSLMGKCGADDQKHRKLIEFWNISLDFGMPNVRSFHVIQRCFRRIFLSMSLLVPLPNLFFIVVK